jgi:outer membrane protein TolC
MRRIMTVAVLCIVTGIGPSFAQGSEMSLAKAYELAKSSSDALSVKEIALQKARLAVNEATSRVLPHVDLQASASYLANPPQGYTLKAGELGTFTPTIPAGVLGPLPISLGTMSIPQTDVTIGAQQHNYFALTASLAQPLFTWGKIRNAIDIATLQVDAAAVKVATQRRDGDRLVNAAYYSVLLAEQSAVVLRGLRDTAVLIVADAQSAFDQGATNRETVLQAKTGLAQIQSKLTQAKQGAATARERLGILTGLDPAGMTLVTAFRDALPPLDEQALLAAALGSSPDLASARTDAGLARKKLAVEQGGSMLLPDVSLGMNLSVSGQEDVPYTAWNWNNSTWDWNLVISLGVKMSVFDGLSSFSRIAQARKDVDAAALGLTARQKQVRLDVRAAVEAALRSDADAGEKQARADYAEERLKNAQSSYDAGLGSRSDLSAAQISAGSAALDLLLARFDREQALADIARLTGTQL